MPKVSIILPTFNRLSFLSSAIESIINQHNTDWELIIVDDGSTDCTYKIVNKYKNKVKQPIKYIYQENQGAYAARNTGLQHSHGKYISFYDSDDEWLPHHLQDCVEALEANPEVDWVYGACRVKNYETGEVISENTFYINGMPRSFLKLKTKVNNKLYIFNDARTIQYAILYGLYNGLQNSVIRSHVFSNNRFDRYQKNAEDQIFVLKILAKGFVIGYLNNVHVNYNIHQKNSSAASLSINLLKQEEVNKIMINGYERLLKNTSFSYKNRIALRKRISQDYFWKLGYSIYFQSNQYDKAKSMFLKGISYNPINFKYWKTYILFRLRIFLKKIKRI